MLAESGPWPAAPPASRICPPELAQLVAGLTLDEMRGLLPQLLTHGDQQMLLDARRKPASRRQPRRDPATLVLRIDLAGAKPPVWRRVEVPSTLMLDHVHDLLQLLFGWYDGHLHRFALGSSVWDRDAESFLSGYDLDEGEQEGTPEAEVRLDEVLAEPGHVLRYVYDYGDEWLHTLKLEKVLPEPCLRLRVLAGKHEAPAEDSGGIWTWNDDPDLEPLDVELLDEDVAEWGAEHVLAQ